MVSFWNAEQKKSLPPFSHERPPRQANLGVAAIIGEMSKRGVSFWNDPKQVILSAGGSNQLIRDVASGAVDALVATTRLLGEDPGAFGPAQRRQCSANEARNPACPIACSHSRSPP